MHSERSLTHFSGGRPEVVEERAEGCREGEGPCSQRPRKLHKERDSVFWVPSKNRQGGGGKGSGEGGGRRETEATFTFVSPCKGGVTATIFATPEGGSLPPPLSERRRTNRYPHPSAGKAGRKVPAFKLSLTVALGPGFDQKGWGRLEGLFLSR